MRTAAQPSSARALHGHGAWLAAALCVVVFALWATRVTAQPPSASDATADQPAASPHYGLDIDAPDELRGLIERQTLIGRWRTRAEYDPGQFDVLFARLPAELQAILQSQGYFDPAIEVDGDARSVRIRVLPGPRTTVGELRLDIDGPVADDVRVLGGVTTAWRLREGAFFDSAAWESDKRALIERLRERGFLRARIVASEARVDVQARSVSLAIHVDSGPRIAFGPLRIRGLSRYPERVVTGQRPWREGDAFEFDALELFQVRLRDSGLFSAVHATPDRASLDADPSARAVPVVVDLIEQPVHRWVAGVGYSTDRGARVQAGYVDRNLLGRGWQLDSGVILEQRRQRAYASVATPIDEQQRFWSLGARLDQQDLQGESVLRATTYLGRGWRGQGTETFTSMQYQTERRVIDIDAGASADRRQALSLVHAWNLRALDSRIDPREGYTLSAQVSGALAGVLTDRSFTRLHGRAMRFIPLDRDAPARGGVIIGLIEMGWVGARSRDDIPSENLFRAGGAQSLRGYAYQSIGVREGAAVVGGRLLGIGSLEFQYPVAPDWRLAAFVDGGNAVDRLADWKLLASYGIGLRWRTPIGPVNVDAAYGEAVRRWRLNLSVGYQF